MANNDELIGRLKALGMMLKFGHDLFSARTFDDATALAVNNSRALLHFETATLLEVVSGKAHVRAQYGQAAVNAHSHLAHLQCRLVESVALGNEPLVVTAGNGLPEELAGNQACYLCVKLEPPAHTDGAEFTFVWLLEYRGEIPGYAANTAKLLSVSISEALYYQRLCKRPAWYAKRHVRKGRVVLVAGLLLLGAMFLRVPESATAEFTLKAPEVTGAYAWFDGPVAKCVKQDGEVVRKGEIVAEYDVSQLTYRLAGAESSLRETEAELALEQQNAFTDQEKLGRAKLLEARRDTMRVAVEEARWYLLHAKIRAPADGVLALADGRAEQLAGKAVRTGDKLFDVYGGKGMVAEIPVNERDASVLTRKLSATLFLHTAPEESIPVKILETARYPELTEQRTYCYKVRVELPETREGALRYGMRGIAKLSGGNVSLGYDLFKSVVLYLRGI